MFKRNKHLITWLLTFWITLVQSGIVFAEYTHPAHKADAKCVICQVADQVSHSVISDINLELNIERYAPMACHEPVIFHSTFFNLPYLIRGPPLA